jgi:translation elongation factor EF-Tu-like GTPase
MEAFAFVDLLEPGEPIKVLARVSVLSIEDGGPSQPISKSFRPNHNFGEAQDNQFYIGQVEVPESTLVHPGETRELMVTFLNGPGLNELLHQGKTWRIQEGSKLVAQAEVLRRQGEA